MILNYLKDKLAKEEKYARLNNKKLVGKFSFFIELQSETNIVDFSLGEFRQTSAILAFINI